MPTRFHIRIQPKIYMFSPSRCKFDWRIQSKKFGLSNHSLTIKPQLMEKAFFQTRGCDGCYREAFVCTYSSAQVRVGKINLTVEVRVPGSADPGDRGGPNGLRERGRRFSRGVTPCVHVCGSFLLRAIDGGVLECWRLGWRWLLEGFSITCDIRPAG